MLAGLLDAEPTEDPEDPQDTLTVEVGRCRLTVRREAPFTTTELARAVAFADVATELLGEDAATYDEEVVGPTPADGADPVVRLATFADTASLMRMHQRCSADSVYRRYAAPLARIDERFARRLLLAGGGALVAVVEDEVVAIASVSTCEAGVVEVSILVEDGWQRRGLGSQLLSAASRVARGHGASDVVLRSRTHNPALMSLAFASGLRARIKLDGDTVVVTVGVDGLKPLTMVPASTTRTSLEIVNNLQISARIDSDDRWRIACFSLR